jgi:hypothetical protein
VEEGDVVVGKANEFGAEIRRRRRCKVREVDCIIQGGSGVHVRDGNLGAVFIRR